MMSKQNSWSTLHLPLCLENIINLLSILQNLLHHHLDSPLRILHQAEINHHIIDLCFTTTQLNSFFLDFLQNGLFTSEEDEVSDLKGGELEGDGATDTGGGTGDEGCFV